MFVELYAKPGEMKEVRFHIFRCISDSKDLSAVNVKFWKLLRSVIKLFKLGRLDKFKLGRLDN